jgi:hypothetical protein
METLRPGYDVPLQRAAYSRSGPAPGTVGSAALSPGEAPDGWEETRPQRRYPLVSSAPVVDDRPPAVCEGPGFDRSPSHGYRGLLCPGCLGLLPFAVRLGDQRLGLLRHGLPVAGVRLLAIARDGGPEGGGAESRGATDSGPTSIGRSREGRHARPRGPEGGWRPEWGGPRRTGTPHHSTQHQSTQHQPQGTTTRSTSR